MNPNQHPWGSMFAGSVGLGSFVPNLIPRAEVLFELLAAAGLCNPFRAIVVDRGEHLPAASAQSLADLAHS